MGEHEQGGMLRNVVVLGLIALIASVIMALVLSLRNKMVDHVDEATPPTIITNLLEPEDFHLQIHDANNNKRPVPKEAYYWDKDQTSLHWNTTMLPNKSWAQGLLKRFDVPAGTKRLKLEVTLKGHTSTYVNTWVGGDDADGNRVLHDYMPIDLNRLNDDTYESFSKTFTVDPTMKNFQLSLETREGAVLEYKNANVTFYNH